MTTDRPGVVFLCVHNAGRSHVDRVRTPPVDLGVDAGA